MAVTFWPVAFWPVTQGVLTTVGGFVDVGELVESFDHAVARRHARLTGDDLVDMALGVKVGMRDGACPMRTASWGIPMPESMRRNWSRVTASSVTSLIGAVLRPAAVARSYTAESASPARNHCSAVSSSVEINAYWAPCGLPSLHIGRRAS